MTSLLDYLEQRKEHLSTFAVRIGRAPSTLTRVLSGQRNPSIDLALDVQKGTEGTVTASDFIALCLKGREAAE